MDAFIWSFILRPGLSRRCLSPPAVIKYPGFCKAPSRTQPCLFLTPRLPVTIGIDYLKVTLQLAKRGESEIKAAVLIPPAKTHMLWSAQRVQDIGVPRWCCYGLCLSPEPLLYNGFLHMCILKAHINIKNSVAVLAFILRKCNWSPPVRYLHHTFMHSGHPSPWQEPNHP